ncbi:signal peptide peptidase SppA [Bacteroides sp. UBA939]|uniref:signal peptide peptidase SppA n=1 Tax=Bacteroides sp. UBA939 TaxID=1946092 RepID=UPI0025BF92C9|nr:signal peptide peptidase SppA [Bacteroides sp. UBA939]
MKDFFKFTLATITGIIVSSVVLFLVSVLIIFGMLSSSESETQVGKNSVMMLDLSGILSERSQDNPFDIFMGEDEMICGLDDILSSIQKAKENENIKGIYLQAGTMGAGFASLEEIRKALADFKTSGKFVVAYGDHYSQRIYHLASVADKVLLNPQGSIGWYGLSSTPIFYKDLLSKIGVEMQVFKVGTYKSAVEPFIATEMSPANREQVTVFLEGIWGQMLSDVSESRGVSKEKLNEVADKMLMFYPAEESVQAGLADTLIYKNDVRNYLKTLVGIDKDDSMPVLGLKDMVNVKKNVPKDKSGNIVAVYYAYGAIDAGSSGIGEEEGINSNNVIRDLRKLKDDKDVKAVVLRVNSPGGSAFGSEQIWHVITELKKEKPVIVSMGDYAASGGYYISCNADSIVADPTTLTGSIGIFGMFPNYKGLTDKIGLSFDVVKTNTYSDLGAMGRPMNEGEKALMQNMVNEGYELFVKRCAEGRGITTDEIKKIAEGRVWTGAKAKELGLVDEIGGLDRALEIAVQKVNLEAYTVLAYPGKKSFFETLMDSDPGNYIQARMLKGKAGELYNQFNWLNNLENCDKIQARIPFELNIN